MSWLVATLGWTAALIAAVLLLRRPLARRFGPQAAYALWLLPFLRLLLPPIELPAWLAPAAEPTTSAALTVPYQLVANADPAVPAPQAAAQTFDWLVLVPAVWLAGAAVFLVWRFAAYFRMRRLLLAPAVQVGEAGRVRLVETPEARSPVAFGVLDPVVALPPGFMASPDRHARDLALAHELAHHRGWDLVANMAVQPLFALHWFNPLGWLGWRALRRDQEAACDARVLASHGLAARPAYAALIARQIAGPRIALSAPMACPVLGEASIVYRLRSLTMTEPSRRRRLMGRALVAAAVLALPLTASISYAADQDAPEAPPAPPAPPPALDAPLPPDAPDAPDMADAPLPPDATQVVVVEKGDGKDGEHRSVRRFVFAPGDGASPRTIERRKVIIRDARDRAAAAREDARHAEYEAHVIKRDAERAESDARRQYEVQIIRAPRPPRAPSAAHAPAPPAPPIAWTEGVRERAMAAARAVPIIDESCDGDARTSTSDDGRVVVHVCAARDMAKALTGLKRAREKMADAEGLSGAMRTQVLAELDTEIARLEAGR